MYFEDRIYLPDFVRHDWLLEYDGFLVHYLEQNFGDKFQMRGRIAENKCGKTASYFFNKYKNLDYLIYSKVAPTKCGFKYSKQKTRIGYVRLGEVPRRIHVRGRGWMTVGRKERFAFMILKEEVLTIGT